MSNASFTRIHNKSPKQIIANYMVNDAEKPFYKITANFTGIVRNDTMAGRNYLVAPMVMVVEGVLNGSGGPLYYPAEELKKNVEAWNCKPVVLYHPESNGQPISACTPSILTSRGLGSIMKTHWEDGKLKAEAWLDVDAVEKIDERVLEAVRNNQMLELSTGLICKVENTSGEFNEVPYDGIARDYLPDHLAVLPDLVGACSIEDGAGFMRVNDKGDSIIVDVTSMDDEEKQFIQDRSRGVLTCLSEYIANQLSHGDIRDLIWSKLNDISEDAWIDSIFDNFFIYVDDGKFIRQGYSVQDSELELVGSPEEVTRVVEFRRADGTTIAINSKEINMNKKQLVNSLIENTATQWREEDRETLMAMNEDVLEKMNPVINEEETNSEENNVSSPNTEESSQESETEPQVDNGDETVEQCLANIKNPAVRESIQNGLKALEAEKGRYIKLLTDNQQNTFTEEQLKSKSVDELKQLATLAANTDEKKQELKAVDNYAGLGEVQSNAVTEEPMGTPTPDFSKK
jgi:hypothetical protein